MIVCWYYSWAKFYKGWTTLSNSQDKLLSRGINDSKTYCVIHQIEISPVDRVIQTSNYQGLIDTLPWVSHLQNGTTKNFVKSFQVCLMQNMWPKVLTRRIGIKIKSFFCCWSFPFFSWPLHVTQGWYCKEKLQVKGSNFSMFIWERCASLCPKFNKLWQLSTINITRPASKSWVYIRQEF